MDTDNSCVLPPVVKKEGHSILKQLTKCNTQDGKKGKKSLCGLLHPSWPQNYFIDLASALNRAGRKRSDNIFYGKGGMLDLFCAFHKVLVTLEFVMIMMPV
jgi:hypothetical protein